jgi:hypothetical protein
LSQRLFANNATALLAAPITSASLSLSVTSGGGALFPFPFGGTSFTATLQKIVANVVTAQEIILVTGRVTDTFTIVRAQESTPIALAWNAGDTVALLPTAGDMQQFAQFDDLQKQLGNFSVDTGSANAYVANFNLTTHSVGTPLRWQAGHANTGNSTFNDGIGAGALVVSPGVNLLPGTIVAGGLYTSTWDGTEFQLSFAPNLSLYATILSLNAYVTNASLVSTLLSYLTATAAANTYATKANAQLTGTPIAPTVPVSTNNTQLATTAFVQAVNNQQIIKTGVFNCANGIVSVVFPVGFPTACSALSVQWEYTSPDTGFVVPGTRTAAGFQYQNGNPGTCSYIAVGF